MNVLICDDDADIAGAVEVYLKSEGYGVFLAADGLEALGAVEREDIHLIIMDVMMPRLDGMRATMKIREDRNIPIIILSAKSEDHDKITGLNAGADDYVTKPFNPLELMARVKSQLRRYTDLGSIAPAKSGVFSSGGLTVDDEAKNVTLDGEQVAVTPIEYGILKFLTENAGKVFSIEQIYERVWNEPAYSPENTVAVHIRRIREKIEFDPKNPKYLKVVWGIGYKIEKIK
ncbi:MAG: response regulator transcription factor [Gracilibacteraceae bacterium]|jgi:DNA-binding response OmpR family regulator|nr:response regulator transcription factor [Gracilibacteraceae bacterium]MDR1322337.1 response regulator transcription factor [Gracilibacteraceae bacterium]